MCVSRAEEAFSFSGLLSLVSSVLAGEVTVEGVEVIVGGVEDVTMGGDIEDVRVGGVLDMIVIEGTEVVWVEHELGFLIGGQESARVW